MTRDGTVFANRMAVFAWGFTCVWIGMLVIFTAVLLRDGPPDGQPPQIVLLAMAVFWIGAAGLLGFALSRPVVRVAVGPDGRVEVVLRYPHRVVRKQFAAGALPMPALVAGEDDEGSPYFRARLSLPDGSVADLAEGHDRDRCLAACTRFLQVAGGRAD
ncbi:hypothetical protein ACRDNQ_13445 [Palleronia sp. KMU-117]|uniref:hypothetical protein n=1 Tax=Palleronia sp. KMU-117 TaxID=3434108 RepID=UPI003D74AAEB